MSALTKIFVVLHVIVSLLLAAGLIVFVNRQENYKKAAEDAKTLAKIADTKATIAKEDADKIAAQMRISEKERDARVAAKDAESAEKDKTIQGLQGQIAASISKDAQATAQITALTSQLGTARDELQKAKDLYASIQNDNDREKGKYAELEVAFNSLKNTAVIGKRNIDYLTEKNKDLDSLLQQATELLRKYNISPGSSTAPEKAALNTEPAININGVVRDYRVINGVPWATISLGSAEAVTRGMQFKVVDQGRFLGYLTVDTVNTHEAVGRLEGDRVNQVRPNLSEVRTHLD